MRLPRDELTAVTGRSSGTDNILPQCGHLHACPIISADAFSLSPQLEQ
jgi:hypothetical protein